MRLSLSHQSSHGAPRTTFQPRFTVLGSCSRSNCRHRNLLQHSRRVRTASARAVADLSQPAARPQTQSGTFQFNGSWIRAPRGRPKGLIHLLGGAFAGAAPELTYALLMRLLADGGYTVIATPYAVTFEHAECALAVQQDFDSTLRQLQQEAGLGQLADERLPVFGVGHSNGALLHLLGNALNVSRHAGDVLVSFNNKEVADAIPVPLTSLSEAVRSARQTPAWRSADPDKALQSLAALAPPGLLNPQNIESLGSILDQLDLVLREVEDGAAEFSPPPADSRAIIAARYSVPATLLIQFKDDGIDETPEMERILLQRNPAGVRSVRLPGTHVTPCGASAEIQIGRAFTPADAVALLLQRAAEEDIRRMATLALRWLDEQSSQYAFESC